MMEQMNPYQAPGADVSAMPAGGGYDESGPFSPRGRFGRLSYLAWGSVTGIVFYIAMIAIVGTTVLTQPMAHPQPPLGMLVPGLAMLVAVAIFAIRRLHDFDASGWWFLLMLVPLANFVMALLLIFKAGSDGANRFGQPRLTRGWEKVLGYITIGFWILGAIGMVAAIVIPLLAR